LNYCDLLRLTATYCDLLRLTATMNTIKSGPGFNLLKKMGWEEGKSLGRKGGGILKPVEVEVTGIRMKGNTRGLGFEHKKGRGDRKDIVRPCPGETAIAVVKIFAAGEHYGAGSSFFGTAYIPGGVMRHICNRARVSTHGLIGRSVRVALVGSEENSKYPWRVVRCI
jgi:hypothetical protein